MCRLPSYSPITGLVLDAAERSACTDHDLTDCAYDAALGLGSTASIRENVSGHSTRAEQRLRENSSPKGARLRDRFIHRVR
jgi:hypothetical protein